MPNDTGVNEKTVDQSIEEWIAKFDKAKGWKPVKAPSPSDDLYASPEHRFEEEHARASSAAVEANSAFHQAEEKVGAIRKRVEKLDPGPDKDKAELALEEAEEELAERKASYLAARKLEVLQSRKVAQLTAVEKDLGKDLRDASEKVATLQNTLAAQKIDPFKDTPKDQKETDFKVVQQMRDNVAKNIEHARNEVFTMTKVIGDQKIERSYAVICPEEYKILHAMLDEAMLTYLTGDVQGAMAAIMATTEKLSVFRAARTGATIIEQEDDFDGRLSLPLGRVASDISWLRQKGFDVAADDLESKNSEIRQEILKTLKTAPNDLLKNHQGDVGNHQATADRVIKHARTCLDLIGKINTSIRTLRVMDAADEADEFDDDLTQIDRGRTLILCEINLTDLAKSVEEQIATVRASQVDDENIDTKALNTQLWKIIGDYADLFKTDFKGNIRTQKDSQTQQKKGVKKDKNIPREAIEEIEMKLLAAQQLLESDSIDALKTAKGYLDDVEKFETSVADNSKDFDRIKTQLVETNKKIERLKEKYGAYEPSRTVRLEAKVKEFEGSYKSQDPAVAIVESGKLFSRAAKLKKDAQECHGVYGECAKLASTVDKKIKALSKEMQRFTIDDVQLTGYFGKYVDDLKAARDKADERDKQSLADAKDLLAQMILDVEEATAVAKKRYKKHSRSALDGPELQIWTALKSDAKAGQAKEADREKNKEKFEAERGDLKPRFEKLQKTFGDLNLDTSDVDLVLQELDSLKTQTKASGDYDDALKRLAELKTDADRHEKTAADMKAFKKLDIATAGKDCAKKVRDFVTAVKGFDRAIKKVGKIEELKVDTDTPMKGSDVKTYLETVAGLIQDADVKKLEDNSAALMTELGKKNGDPRKPREAALSAVRTLVGALEANGPIAHFRNQPFTGGNPELDAVVAALPRLEIKLLTAVPK